MVELGAPDMRFSLKNQGLFSSILIWFHSGWLFYIRRSHGELKQFWNSLLFHRDLRPAIENWFCHMGRRKDGGGTEAGKLHKQWKSDVMICFSWFLHFSSQTLCDHNFAVSARIWPSFCTVAARGEIKIFCLDRFKNYLSNFLVTLERVGT